MFKYAKEIDTFIINNGNSMKWVSDFINLIYPAACKACNEVLVGSEEIICTNCLVLELPYTTDYSEIEKRFWGKLPIKRVVTLLKFSKQGKVQTLLHQLKYRDAPEVGVLLGEMLGQKMLKENIDVDLLIPVPMHKEKQKQRGYNQAEKIAEGIATILNVELCTSAVVKSKQSLSQTKKTREERSKNVENLFEVITKENVANKKIALIDDVLTTGATLEACGNLLLKAGALEINIIAIAATT